MDIAKSSLKIALAKVGTMGLTFVGIAYFARQLGAASLGVFFLFLALLGVSALPANLGTRIAVEKRISEGGPGPRILGTGIAIKTGLLLVIVALMLLLRPYLNGYLGEELTVLLAIAIVFKEFAGLTMSVLKGELRVGETATLQFTYSVVWVSLGALLVTVGFDHLGLIYAVIVARGVQLALGVAKTTVGVSRPTTEQARSLVEYAKYSVIPEIDGQVHSWLDVLIIGFILTQAAVGTYEVAWRVASPVIIMTTAIGTTIFPQISSWESADAYESVERLIPRIITPSLVFIFPAFFGVVLLSREILGVIFGTEFASAWLVLIVLVAAKFPRAIRAIAGKSLLGLDRPDLVTHAAVVDIVANMTLNLVLIWQFGILGAAVGTTLSMTLGTVHRVHYLSRFIDIRVPYRELAWCLTSAAGMYVVLFGARQAIAIDTVPRVLAIILAGAVIYWGFVALYEPLRTQFLEQARSIVR